MQIFLFQYISNKMKILIFILSDKNISVPLKFLLNYGLLVFFNFSKKYFFFTIRQDMFYNLQKEKLSL